MGIIVKVHNGFFYKGKAEIISGTDGAVIKAKGSATYELLTESGQVLSGVQGQDGRSARPSPNTVDLKKQGVNLVVHTDDTTFTIANYFLYPNSQLVGLGSDGSYYTYLPVQSEWDAFFGRDIWLGAKTEGSYTAALAGEPKTTPWLLEPAGEPMSSYILPVLGGIGASALLLAAVEGSSKKDSSSSNNESKAPDAPTANISNDGTQVSGKAAAGSQVVVSSSAGELGSAKADSKGNYQITLSETQTAGERLVVVARKDGATSTPTLLSAPDSTAPVDAKSLAINDDGTQVTGEAENGARVSVRDTYGNVLGAAVAGNDGKFTVALLQAQAAKQSLTVVVTDAAGNASKGAALTGAKGANTAISTIIDLNGLDNTVLESAPVGTKVNITAKASDYETITYTLTDNAGGKFTIDQSTGVVTTAAVLDYETASKHSIGVRATSGDGSFRDITFEVLVRNENDNAVGSLSDSNAADNQVATTASAGATTGLTAKAVDADGDLVTYSLKDNADGLFAINAGNGEVITAASLAGKSGSFDVVVVATSSDGSTSEGSFTIALVDGAQAKSAPQGDATPSNAGLSAEHTIANIANTADMFALLDAPAIL